ncbi:hypothetical protein N7G274_008562 [Stereocaulon virgatum]|uniref:Uncharacterized protein n=1 Tax=Stereocaulon virgatum TaxID=373712 RepID=A0ABR3ZYP2_9LECA
MPLRLLTLLFIGLASSASIKKIQLPNATFTTSLDGANPLDILECTPKPRTPRDTRPLLAWCRIAVEIYPFPKSEQVGIFHISGEPDEFKLPYVASLYDKASGGCEVTVDIPFHLADSCSWREIWLAAKDLMETCREPNTNYPHTGGYTMIGRSGNIKIVIQRDTHELSGAEKLGMNGSAVEWMT